MTQPKPFSFTRPHRKRTIEDIKHELETSNDSICKHYRKVRDFLDVNEKLNDENGVFEKKEWCRAHEITFKSLIKRFKVIKITQESCVVVEGGKILANVYEIELVDTLYDDTIVAQISVGGYNPCDYEFLIDAEGDYNTHGMPISIFMDASFYKFYVAIKSNLQESFYLFF